MMLRTVPFQGWLTLAYGLSVVLAQGLHTHHEADQPTERVSQLLACCASDHLHVEAGVPTDGDSDPADCLSCQLQIDHQGWLIAPVQVAPLDVRAARFASSEEEPAGDPPLPRGRSPPLS